MSPLPRRYKVSRSRYRKPQEPTPRFDIGDQAGEFNVLEYLGYSRIKPTGEPVKLSQEHHWYKVRCACGKIEVHTQQQLIDVRRHRACASCINELEELRRPNEDSSSRART
jgi:hypothetical protein